MLHLFIHVVAALGLAHFAIVMTFVEDVVHRSMRELLLSWDRNVGFAHLNVGVIYLRGASPRGGVHCKKTHKAPPQGKRADWGALQGEGGPPK